MRVEKISVEEFKAAEAKKGVRGKYQEVFDAAVADGEPRKISGLSRGQVAAVARKAKEAGLLFVTDYADGSVSVCLKP